MIRKYQNAAGGGLQFSEDPYISTGNSKKLKKGYKEVLVDKGWFSNTFLPTYRIVRESDGARYNPNYRATVDNNRYAGSSVRPSQIVAQQKTNSQAQVNTQTPDKKTGGTGVKVRRKTPVHSTVSPSPVFNRVHVGGRVDNTRLGNIDRQKLINIGFNDNDFTSVTNFQNAVNRYYSKTKLGSVKVDNKWGNQTQAAYDKLLSDANEQLDQYSIKAADDGTPTVPESLATKSTITVNNTSVEPRNNYNRADTRDVIRLWGRNPYNYGGLQRRSFRHYLNGNATDKDLRRVQSMGLFNPYPSAKSTTTLMPQYNLDNYFYNWTPQFTNQNQTFNYQ